MKSKENNHISASKVHHSFPPPLPVFGSQASIEEWLSSLCNSITDNREYSFIHFRLLDPDSTNKFSIWFYGTNNPPANRPPKQDRYIPMEDLLDKEPKFQSKEFYHLSEKETAGLDKGQVFQFITNVLKKYTSTDQFKNCFLSKAKEIITDFNGETIWAKPN